MLGPGGQPVLTQSRSQLLSCSPGDLREHCGLVSLGYALSDLPSCAEECLTLQALCRRRGLGGSILVFCAVQLVLSAQLPQQRADPAKPWIPTGILVSTGFINPPLWGGGCSWRGGHLRQKS